MTGNRSAGWGSPAGLARYTPLLALALCSAALAQTPTVGPLASAANLPVRVPAPSEPKSATVALEPAIGLAPDRYAQLTVTPVAANVTRWALTLDGGFPDGTRITWDRGLAGITLPALLAVDGKRTRWQVGLGGLQQVWAGDDADGGPMLHVEVGVDEDAALIPADDLSGGTIRLDVMTPDPKAPAVPEAVGPADIWPPYPTPKKQVAFTFDDFPCPGRSERLMEALRAHCVPATFFVIGHKAEASPELLRQAVLEGYGLGNHTFSHLRLATVSPAEAREEISRGAEAIRKATGETPRYFRPPGGRLTPELATVLAQMGLELILWHAMTNDYDPISPDQIRRDILAGVGSRERAVICLHDGSAATVEAIGPLVHGLRMRGYQTVTLDAIMGH
jgi:peptidoglycan/xylan/chitin deacetylase (PgdA/CDA1 family)